MKPLSFLASVRLLGIALAVATAGHASAAKPASTAKLAGTYTGTYSASGAIVGVANYTGSSSGPTTATLKATQGKKGAKLTLSGQDTANSGGGTYSAVLTFKKDGTCTTTAIVPGFVDLAGTGTWKLKSKGKKISFTFTATLPVGTINATGTISANGTGLVIKSTGTANSPLATGSGQYSYSGSK